MALRYNDLLLSSEHVMCMCVCVRARTHAVCRIQINVFILRNEEFIFG